MLFHSQGFILIFLPLVLAAYYATARLPVVREWVLLVASLVFYSWWDVRFLPILLGQATATWGAVVLYRRNGRAGWLWTGVAINLASLIAFKYTVFLAGTIAELLGRSVPPMSIVLPIGISFFTFQLACYLVDVARGDAHVYPWRRVTLFVSLFPHLIAGPIVRHHQIMPQLDADPLRSGLPERLSKGAAFFVIGCTKKVFLADPMARFADPIFAAAATSTPSLVDAWHGALAFSFQLFLDFSAYSEMAVGLGLMLGVRFPDNFDMPYRATDLTTFWRRWHITLSQLIRDYLYIPLGGSRHGWGTYVKATLISMALCGLWHGAGWTFVAWGAMHGAGLVACRAWQKNARPLPVSVGWGLTALFVLAGWVLFRSPDFATAAHMLAGLAGLGSGLAPTVAIKPILAGALFASVLVPSTQRLVEGGWLRPVGYQAVGLALLLVVCILEVGQGQPTTFIYFQF
jgi:D-alanyl-lipoteichoic acid acyltransferase DltB (MBOAT superfamily)